MWTEPAHERSMRLPLFPTDRLEEQVRDAEAELRRAIEGEVRFDAGSRALYAADASNYRQVPIGVVVPRTVEDVIATVAVCERHGLPLLSRGAGTSLAGQCCNVAIVLDFTKYLNGILALDAERSRVHVLPGTVLDHMRHETQREANLTFGPDPSTHAYCTIGGMLGNDSCGVHAQAAGRMVHNVESLEVLTYDGERLRVGATSEAELRRLVARDDRVGDIYRKLVHLRDSYADRIRKGFPQIPRRVSGYNNLDQLLPENGFQLARALVGTEGTCVTILESTLKLIPFKRHAAFVVLGYPDVYRAADDLDAVLEHSPAALEGIDRKLCDDITLRHLHESYLHDLPEGDGWLLVQFWGDSKEEARGQAEALLSSIGRGGPGDRTTRILTDPEAMHRLWQVRESGLGATARLPGKRDAWPGWEDSAVPPSRVGLYLRDLRALFDRFHYDAALYGHFGQGCVHCRINFELGSREGIETYRAFAREAAALVVSHGGSLSGEHGDGQARAELLEIMYGPELVQCFREFKEIWDPDNHMNPGKLIDPYGLDENLRFGADYAPTTPRTHFAFEEDNGHFFRATERCVGVGKCRRDESGTMCPSYRVTREEKHATRGRAHLLFEMLQGDVVEKGWRSEEVHEALDLCLSCKGCKGECPMQVDMATWKAEFLSHYWEGRVRPRSAYAFGLVRTWARLGAWVPNIANTITHLPGLGRAAKWIAGMSAKRSVPSFAPRTFKRSWFSRPHAGTTGERVILWPDTFNDHFHPEILHAAATVLGAAGFDVTVPRASLCCGRPLYDYGFLDRAKSRLRDILEALDPEIDRGTLIVGLEPSCVSVFRDELVNLFPDDPRARRLASQTLLLSELLVRKAPRFRPKIAGRALVHGHCHHQSVLGFDDEKKLLGELGLEAEVLDAGCCGMAGAFGFEREHFDISQQIGERTLLPRVRQTARNDVVVTNGFSCREQMMQLADREPVHLAELLAGAMQGARASDLVAVNPSRVVARSMRRVATYVAALVVGAGLVRLMRPQAARRWALRG